jgi:hypothetical protein
MPARLQYSTAGLAGLALLLAAPAMADITVIGRYKLVNGDTLTRASYYTTHRVRATLPNGYEIIYNQGADSVALVDHTRKRYWEGPRGEADSIAMKFRAGQMKALQANATPEQREKWTEIYSALGDSVHFARTGRDRKIAGYGCTEWVLTAGQYLRQTHWVARALSKPDFSEEVEKVVLATITDPLGRGLMKLVLQARVTDGLTLGGTIRFKTMSQQGETSWEAIKVDASKIPPSAWAIPEGYQRWQPPPADSTK